MAAQRKHGPVADVLSHGVGYRSSIPQAATNSCCDLLHVGRVRPAPVQHPSSLAREKAQTWAQQMGREAAAPDGMWALQKTLPKEVSAAKTSISNRREKKSCGNPHTFYLEQIFFCLKFFLADQHKGRGMTLPSLLTLVIRQKS